MEVNVNCLLLPLKAGVNRHCLEDTINCVLSNILAFLKATNLQELLPVCLATSLARNQCLYG